MLEQAKRFNQEIRKARLLPHLHPQFTHRIAYLERNPQDLPEGLTIEQYTSALLDLVLASARGDHL